ncbi:NADH-quinone oxidoreductase subunit A [Oscillochloris sp. ZM17-4]|uniref:NADH-quinone oxidoreductase subunit A n=1 Tax=Oscillochloris sp. ZM17-4 TaxID=2866714 RepID=UPI001C736BFD|nr:NADH-quinone oxidoreductase subunit A [Oscillochloris sp. ZM17-4]MBX0327878.1 NADH-quinone oxidoreductase subunit A [Oscillochloris sp. ZM17-4]
MLATFTPILVMFLIALFISVFTIGASALLGPRHDTRRKLEPYESGMEPIGPAIRRIPVKFYIVAMLFIIFDIEVIFFYPFALVFRALGGPGLLAMGVFFLVLLVGFAYEWKKGALRWE